MTFMFFNEQAQKYIQEINELRGQLAACRAKNKRLMNKNKKIYQWYQDALAANADDIGRDECFKLNMITNLLCNVKFKQHC